MGDRERREEILGEGRYLVLKSADGWEWVERRRINEIAVIVAVTSDQKAVLVEQYRTPVRARMIEWAAGLVGDEESLDGEHLLDAANRELEEETGFRAGEVELFFEGPPSGGQSSEIVSFIRASKLERVGPGGGVGDEDIKVHLVPLAGIDAWLDDRAKEGLIIDAKIYAGLYFLSRMQAR